jgi:hypothetical protein
MTQPPESEISTEDTAPVTVPDPPMKAPPSTQKPSRGRVVMYIGTHCSGHSSDGDDPFTAIVTDVQEDGSTVSLAFFSYNGVPDERGAQLVPFDPTATEYNSWHWPPRVS